MIVNIKGLEMVIPDSYSNAVLFGGLTEEDRLADRLFRLYKTEYCARHSKLLSEVDDSIIVRELKEDLLADSLKAVKKMYAIAEAEAIRDGLM